MECQKASLDQNTHAADFPIISAYEEHPNISNIIRTNYHANLFTLNNFFSASECEHYVSEAEKIGLKDVSSEYHKKYRDCLRIVVSSSATANQIWNRLLPNLVKEDVAEVAPFGIGTGGSWRPIGVNSCLRISRYDPPKNPVAHHFNKHRDGCFVIMKDYRSVYTLILYLNDGFAGGETVFYPANAEPISIVPKIGKLVVFTHDIEHEGLVLQTCEIPKYILRTDLIFQRISLNAEPKDYGLFDKAEQLYQKSIDLQRMGDAEGSTLAYINANEIHATFSPSISAVEKPKFSSKLPYDLWLNIICYLDNKELYTFGSTCKEIHKIVQDDYFWCMRYKKRWGTGAVLLSMFLDHIQSKRILSLACKESQSTEETQPVFSELTAGWYHLYQYRRICKKEFVGTYVDLGSYYTKFGTVGQKPFKNSIGRNFYQYDAEYIRERTDFGCIRSTCVRSYGHYWSAYSGYYEILYGVFDENNRPEIYDDTPSNHRFMPFLTESGEMMLTWVPFVLEAALIYIYGFMFPRALAPQRHPLLVAVPPWFTSEDIVFFQKVLFVYLRLPYLSMINSSFLALLGNAIDFGLVIQCGARHYTVQAVFPDGSTASIGRAPVYIPFPKRMHQNLSKLEQHEVEEMFFSSIQGLEHDAQIHNRVEFLANSNQDFSMKRTRKVKNYKFKIFSKLFKSTEVVHEVGIPLVEELEACLKPHKSQAKCTEGPMDLRQLIVLGISAFEEYYHKSNTKFEIPILITGGNAGSIYPKLKKYLPEIREKLTNYEFRLCPLSPEPHLDVAKGSEVFLLMPESRSAFVDINNVMQNPSSDNFYRTMWFYNEKNLPKTKPSKEQERSFLCLHDFEQEANMLLRYTSTPWRFTLGRLWRSFGTEKGSEIFPDVEAVFVYNRQYHFSNVDNEESTASE